MTPQLPSIGETLGGRYELLDTLGEGGMSVVFRARDHASDAEVALKLLTPRYLGRPEREQRLLDEADYLEQLHGTDGIIALIDHGHFAEHHDWPYLALELLEGRALNWVLIKHEFDPAGVRELALGIARALASCHAAGIVHRDLTPSNVSVSLDPIRVQLFDFSHASSGVPGPRILPGDSGRLTGSFDVPGTSGYMGPEQASSSVADPQMDVFAYGVLLYEIITGRNPYPKVSHAEFIELQRNGNLEPPRLAAWAYKVNPKWADLIRDCTLPEPSERPSMATLVQLIEAIEPVEAVEPVEPVEPVDAFEPVEPVDAFETTEPVDLTEPVRVITEDQTQRMDTEQLGRLQAELRRSTEPAPAPSRPAEIGAWGSPAGEPAGPSLRAWGPPPSGTTNVPEPSPDPEPPAAPDDAQQRPAFAQVEPQQQPAFARADAKPIPLPPLPLPEPVELDDAGPSPLSRPRRWIPALLLLGAAAVIGLAVLASGSASSSSTDRPGAPSSADPNQLARENSQVPLPEDGPDPEVAETGASQAEPFSPEPLVRPQAKPNPPKPAATPAAKPKPEPKPDCQDPRADAERAQAQHDWSAVIRHTAKQRCWADNQTRRRLRVEALAQAKRWDECHELAQSSDDAELTRWGKFCAKNL